jgi:hypothetical protein
MAIIRDLWIHPSTLVPTKFTSTMDWCQRLVVVHGSGQILNRVCADVMQYSQWLLDVLSSQGWNAAAIEHQLKLMSSMIKGHHGCFTGIWFSGFVRMGQVGPLEMITTREVRTVSNWGVVQSIQV